MNKIFLTGISLALIVTAQAQQRTAITTKDYEQAQRFIGTNAEQLVDYGSVRPNWLPGDRFWYRNLTAKGSEFILVDPAKATRSVAFDQQKLATALSAATGKTYEAAMLPFQSISFSPDNQFVSFRADGKAWKYDLKNFQISADATPTPLGNEADAPPSRRETGNEVLSPDKKGQPLLRIITCGFGMCRPASKPN
ncbi:hypothetical protein [Spirosoma sp. KNUC1025]|uniref:hypothetical protein n=1 Tax=Spirosoma sp. KNUC1025 TaxID=2894082 RepID=UPI00386C4269|nr:hypothetical protein LN737_22715 [Spirosoma sp. KNUC1025]